MQGDEKAGASEAQFGWEISWEQFEKDFLPDLGRSDASVLVYRGDRLLFVNQAVFIEFGYSGMDLGALDDCLWKNTGERERFKEHLKLVLEGKKLENNFYLLTKSDGQEVRTRIQFGQLTIKSQEPVCGCVLLKSASCPIEKFLDEEFVFKTILDKSLNGVAMVDEHLELIYANPAFLAIYGCASFNDLKNIPILKTIAPECLGMVMERARNWMEGRPQPSRFVYKIIRKDGEKRDLEVETDTVFVKGMKCRLNTIVDITDKVRSEAALRESEERRKILADTVLDIIAEMDTNFSLIWLNGAGFKFFGTDAINKNVLDFFTDREDKIRMAEMLGQIIEGRKQVVKVETARDGNENSIKLAWICKPLKDANGKIISILSIARELPKDN